ncbi:hypothetical protein QQF64_034880 [Cirrhinus molitorella]|uniref:Uncharacterized protein n=1 Tax=Cirrhinus molitorella TaxID=172907 RepID=A0ABR3NEI5_9TELE
MIHFSLSGASAVKDVVKTQMLYRAIRLRGRNTENANVRSEAKDVSGSTEARPALLNQTFVSGALND